MRITPKKQVREGVQGLGEVAKVQFSYDAEGVAAAEKEALTWPGVYYVRTWMNEGELGVGDSIMYVLIGATSARTASMRCRSSSVRSKTSSSWKRKSTRRAFA